MKYGDLIQFEPIESVVQLRKTPEQEAQILSLSAVSETVRNIELVVDVMRPVAVAADAHKDLNIGTVTLSRVAAMKADNIQIDSYISLPNLRVVHKRGR